MNIEYMAPINEKPENTKKTGMGPRQVGDIIIGHTSDKMSMVVHNVKRHTVKDVESFVVSIT